MRKLSKLILLGLLLMSVSCEKDNNKPNEDEQIAENNSENNNSAILTGNTIGDNSEAIEKLWKIGKVLIENESHGFYLDTVYFARSSSNSDYVYWVIPVRNILENAHAFIKATGIKLLDVDNNVIYEDEINYTYVNGSCGNRINSTTFLTNTFLRSNEVGFFLGIDKVNFEQVEKIKLETIKYSNAEYVYSSINVIPTSYQASNDKVYVNIKNESNKTVYVMMSPFILLGEDNKPLNWSYLSPDFDITSIETVVSSNSTGTLVDYDFYNGTCNKIRPILEVNLESMDFKSATLNENTNSFTDEFIRQTKIKRDIKLRQEEGLQ